MKAQPQSAPDVSYDDAIARARAYIDSVTSPEHCEHGATSLAIVALPLRRLIFSSPKKG